MRAAPAFIIAAFICGCSAGPAPPDLRRLASEATGVEGAISFQVSGQPLDVTPSDPLASGLPLDRAVREALRHDPRVHMAVARARAALADARQARLLPNPLLTVMVRFPDGGGADPMIEADLMADVLSVLTLQRRASAADRRMRAACAEALATVLDVLGETRTQYAAAQAAEARLAVLEARRKAAEELLTVTQGLFKAGELGVADVLGAEAGVDDLEARQVEQRGAARSARLTLARLIGQPSSLADWQMDPLPETGAAPAGSEQERAWVEVALRRRPEVQAARWALLAAGDEAAVAAAESFEGLDAGASTEREDGDWVTGPALSVPLPLFDWGGARREKARMMRVEARHRLTAARRQAVEEVRRALSEVAATREALAIVRDRQVPRLRDRRQRVEALFKTGATGITPVLESEQDLQAAVSAQVDLQEKAAAAIIRLHRAAGGPGVVPAQ